MKKGIRGHDLKTSGIKNTSVKCENIGFEYLQLVLEKTIPDFKRGEFSQEYALQIKEDLGNTKVAVLGSYINPSNPDEEQLKSDMNAFKEKIRYATILNPVVVGTETGIYIGGKTHTEEAYQHLLKTVKELVSEAEKCDVCIGIEGVHCFVIDSPEMLKKLIDDVDSPNIKAIFDPCNLINEQNYLKQDEIINSMFDLLSDKIEVLHAKDFVVEDGKMKLVAPGEGMLNYKLIFERLDSNTPIIMEELNDEESVKAFSALEKIKNG